MNVNELRINNLIKWSDESDEIIEVYGISIDDSGDVWILSKDGENSMIEEFEPIPLTEEWFIDHGFKKDKDGVINIGKSLYWLPSGYWGNTGVIQIAFGYSPLINCPCEFVHQLQNIYFAFYGEELELEQTKLRSYDFTIVKSWIEIDYGVDLSEKNTDE